MTAQTQSFGIEVHDDKDQNKSHITQGQNEHGEEVGIGRSERANEHWKEDREQPRKRRNPTTTMQATSTESCQTVA